MIFSAFNIDVLALGIAIAANLILGFVIFFGDSKSHTNKLFFAQTIVLSVWSLVNYLSYRVTNPQDALLLVRLVLFFAVPNSIIFFFLVHTFPSAKITAKPWVVKLLIVFTCITMILTLTPFVFSGVNIISGGAPEPIVAPGILLFFITAVLSIPVSLFLLIKKFMKAKDETRPPLRLLLIGVVIMFASIVLFDFVLPTIFHNTRFIPLSAVFTFPFVAFTAYAIVKHHLLNIKVITTEILTFILAIVSLVEVVISKDALTLVFRSGVFALVLAFGILLIKSVLKEVEQREKLEVLTKELEAANEKLKVADRMKSQFLSFASHQVKSPMTVVKGYASLIQDGSYGTVPEKVKEVTQKIKETSDGLIALVNNLLDLRKLEEGKIEYKFEQVDLAGLARAVAEEIRQLAVNKSLEFKIDIPPSPVMLNLDKEKIQQVVQNLIDNSIKYTEKGWVSIELRAENGKVRISVSDSGIGIPKDLIPTLFEQFNRGSDAAKKIQGTGLGLFIAKQFVETNKGRIWAESDGPGKGSRFIVEFDSNSGNSNISA